MMDRVSARRAALVAGVTLLAMSGVGVPRTVAAESTASSSATASTGTTFVVDKTADDGDNQLNDDLCMTASGGCSLRAAIQQANATDGANRIEFNIPGGGPHTIVLGNKLATIDDSTGPLVIDGYTQPGAAENTDPLASNANIQIGVTLASYVNGRPAFAISSADNVIRGLAIYNAYHAILIAGDTAVRNDIIGNFIGTNPEATFYIPWGWTDAAGVQLDVGASFNRIGTPAIADRNVISGNKSWGLRIEQNESHGNKVQNNIIGLHPSGTDRLPQQGGIDVQWGARDNLIGGRAEREHNVISGLEYSAIDFSHESFNNEAIGNYIGTDLTGKQAFEWTTNQFGLLVKDDARLNYYEANVVVNQTNEGIRNKHNYTGANTFVNNLIGLSLDGSPYGNGGEGVQLRGHDDVYERNVIANNNDDGIYLDSTNASGANDDELTERNRLTANSFWNNGGDGIHIDGTVTQANLSAPTFTSASAGIVTGTACVGCEVELYLADAFAATPQGRQYLGTALADAVNGDFTFSDARIDTGRPVTALTIDHLDNTSQFADLTTPGAPLASWTELLGDFVAIDVDGRQVAVTPDTGAGISGGADVTTSIVNFDLVAPTDGDYVIDVEVYAVDGNADSFWVVIDNEAGSGALYDLGNNFGSLQLDQVNERNIADPVVVNLTAGTHRIGFALREEGSGIATASLRLATPVTGELPVVTNAGDLTFVRNAASSALISSTPAGVTYTALRLPDGLAIDPDTGLVSGTPERAGRFPVTILAHNVDGIDAVDAMWTVELEQLPPTVDAIADQAGDIDVASSLQVIASDPNDDALTYSATSLPTGLQIDGPSGLISGTPTEGGDFNVTVTADDGVTPISVSFVWSIDAGFVCQVVGSTLSWSDAGASTYHVRHILGGEDNYVTSVSGALSIAVPSQFGVYKVVTFNPTNQVAQCDAPLGEPQAFSCTVTGDTLAWTDQGANNYYVRQLINGEDNYLTTVSGSSGLEYTVPSQFGAYKVVAYAPSRIETQCDAPLGAPQPFTCTVTGDTLSWTNQGANNYYIRQLINGEDTYLGSVDGIGSLEFTVPSQFGAYKVIAYAPSYMDATCDAPLGGPQVFVCTVTGDTLTWTNQGVSTYYVRQQVSGSDQYIGSTSGLSYELDDAFGTFEIRFNLNGDTFTTTCAGVALPDFTCSVDATGLVSWTDQQASSYFVRRVFEGQDRYVGASSGLTYQLGDTTGSFRVLYNRSGSQFTSSCPLV